MGEMVSVDEVSKVFRNCRDLKHIPLRYDDLIDCVIYSEIAKVDPDLAVTLHGWLTTWGVWGYSEQESVDIFYALIDMFEEDFIAAKNIDVLMSEIQTFLENK
jgi:hypothetical protein